MIGPLAYIGGKRRLAPRIIRLLPAHVTYVEPFAGGAQVFFHKPASRVEVLNDLDGETVNFLRVCQQHHHELARWMRYAAASRALFHWFAAHDISTLTDIQRAARFLYLQKNSFGGRRQRQAFHYAVTKPSNFQPQRLPQLLAQTADRLQRVQIEHLPYEQVLARYDRPTTLFYLDPPYQGRRLYVHNLSDADFTTLAMRLAAIRGRFLLSINDTPLVRSAFQPFYCRELRVSYTSSRLTPQVTELLFSNHPLPEVQ